MTQVSDGGTEAAVPSFDDLLTPDASPASDPQITPEHDATAAGQPEGESAETRQGAQSSTEDDDRSPFIPRSRFDEVNTKYRDAKQWREQYAWAEGLQPQHVQTMQEWFGKAVADPRAFALSLLDELGSHPDHAAQIRSELARRLGTRAAAASPTAETGSDPLQPDVEIVDAQGQVVGRTYSDKTLAKFAEQIRSQTVAQIKAEYDPKLVTLDTIQQRERDAEQTRQATTFATSFVQELSSLPLFDAHKAKIGEYLQAHPSPDDSPAAVQAAAYRAYHAVVGPMLKNGSTTLADLQRKAQANTGINPGAASSASPKAVSSFFDPALQW